MTQRQIIALGGGGFSVEPENPTLELYILRQVQTATPRVGLIPTASGDSDRYVATFYTCSPDLNAGHATSRFSRGLPNSDPSFLIRMWFMSVEGIPRACLPSGKTGGWTLCYERRGNAGSFCAASALARSAGFNKESPILLLTILLFSTALVF